MNQDAGVSSEEVQYAICTGQGYGGKKWSDSQKQEACQQYEALTGKKVALSSTPQSPDLTGVTIILTILLATVIGIILFYVRFGKKS